MFATTIPTVLAVAVTAGQIADAPDRLISNHGVELSSDGRVFVLFAALNGLGYSEESKRKGPPLEASVYHPLRVRSREGMRKLASKDALKNIRKLFDDHPAVIEAYLAAILSHDLGLQKLENKPAGAAATLNDAVAGLRTLAEEPALSQLFDDLALDQRRHAKKLMAAVEKDFDEAQRHLGIRDLRAPAGLVIVPNPLDSHGAVREVSVGESRYLVVGPGLRKARKAILAASLRPVVKKLVDDNWGSARFLNKHWDGLRVSKRITQRFADGQAYLTETLTRALTYRTLKRTGVVDKDDEDFIDRQTKDGLRWARAALRALGSVSPGERIESFLPKVIARTNP